jgi:hypothetical protein
MTTSLSSLLGVTPIAGTLPVAYGGTGLTAPGTTGNVLTSNGTTWLSQPAPISLPTQTSNSGKYLTTDGTNASWATVVGGLVSTSTKTANYTAVSNDLVRINATSSFTITMPASPADGAIVGLMDIGNTFSTNNITVAPGVGATIEGDSSVILDVSNTYAAFTYISSTTNWRLMTIPVSGGGLQVSPLKVTNYTAAPSELIRANTTAGSFTITLPTTPTDGTSIGVLDVMSKFGTNALTVVSSGSDTIEGDTSVILDISHTYAEFIYSTSTANWLLKGTPTNNNSVVNIILDDISNQCTGVTSVFNLTTNGTLLNTIVDSKDLDVFVNGLKIVPYVDQVRYPWLTPYDAGTGFRVNNGKLILYKAPFIGSTVSLNVKSISASRQTQRYPFNAITIALGD